MSTSFGSGIAWRKNARGAVSKLSLGCHQAVDLSDYLRRVVLNRAARAFSSFSTSKIDKIVEDIEQDAHQISLFVPIVQERMNRGERENAAEERRLAGVAREQQNQMLELFLEERKGIYNLISWSGL